MMGINPHHLVLLIVKLRSADEMENNTPITTNRMDELTDTMNKIRETQKSISLMLVATNGMLLRYIQDPPDEYIIAALKQNGLALQFVPASRQTQQMKWIALNNEPRSIQYVHKPTLGVWLHAVRSRSDSIKYIRNHPDFDTLTELEVCRIYKTFIQFNPRRMTDIRDDIKGLPCEKDLWFTVISIDDHYMSICPEVFAGEILDKIMECNPQVLEYAPKSLWTADRIKTYVKRNPLHIRTVIDECPDIDPVDAYKFALSNAKSYGVIYRILRTLPEKLHTLDNMKEFVNATDLSIFNMMPFHLREIDGFVSWIIDNFSYETINDKITDKVALRKNMSFIDSVKLLTKRIFRR